VAYKASFGGEVPTGNGHFLNDLARGGELNTHWLHKFRSRRMVGLTA